MNRAARLFLVAVTAMSAAPYPAAAQHRVDFPERPQAKYEVEHGNPHLQQNQPSGLPVLVTSLIGGSIGGGLGYVLDEGETDLGWATGYALGAGVGAAVGAHFGYRKPALLPTMGGAIAGGAPLIIAALTDGGIKWHHFAAAVLPPLAAWWANTMAQD